MAKYCRHGVKVGKKWLIFTRFCEKCEIERMFNMDLDELFKKHREGQYIITLDDYVERCCMYNIKP